jgi:hypothetical protein
MKTITRTLVAATAALVSLTGITPSAQAAKVTLDGDGFYRVFNPVVYRGGAKQSGRYANFGADYYRDTSYSMRFINNRSGYRSGSLSFEFWAMPFYGASKGIVLMTRGLAPLDAGATRYDKRSNGYAIYLDEFRFPEINIWEYTRSGWSFRDALAFKRDNLL